MSVSWENTTADYGNTLNPAKTKKTPKLKLIASKPSIWSKDKTPQLTIAMSDPDAPSRDNPEWSEICHWIATDMELTKPDNDDDDDDDDSGSEGHDVKKRVLDVMPYKPPGPPPKTGKHRYVFVALAPINGTTEKLSLSKPGDRQHWGFKHERDGLKMWADEMGLAPVGKYDQCARLRTIWSCILTIGQVRTSSMSKTTNNRRGPPECLGGVS